MSKAQQCNSSTGESGVCCLLRCEGGSAQQRVVVSCMVACANRRADGMNA